MMKKQIEFKTKSHNGMAIFFSGLFLLFVVLAFTQQSEEQSVGKKLFEQNCKKCHGKSGDRGWFGAKNLRKSTLNDDELFKIISEGRNVMPSWKDELNSQQIKLIIGHIKTLKNN
jgi:cytochrome c6